MSLTHVFYDIYSLLQLLLESHFVCHTEREKNYSDATVKSNNIVETALLLQLPFITAQGRAKLSQRNRTPKQQM